MAATSPSPPQHPTDHGSSSKSSQDSSPSHPSARSHRPSPQVSPWSLPRVFVFNPFPAWDSPLTDERCFIYCSQSSRGRRMSNDPWCRTICFRRVYGHEVHDGSYDASKDINGFLKPSEPLPLPPEGQPPEVVPQGIVEYNEKTRYWKEGRYIWVSKSRWAAQERLDSMLANLPDQTAWMRYKEMLEKRRLAGETDYVQNVEQANQADSLDSSQDANTSQPSPIGPEIQPFTPTHAIRDSLLIPITPVSTLMQETLRQKLSFILSPSYKLLSLFGRSFADGTQTRLLEKAYQQATNGSTVTLIRNVWSMNESFWKGSEEQKELEERKKKGGGGEVDRDL